MIWIISTRRGLRMNLKTSLFAFSKQKKITVNLVEHPFIFKTFRTMITRYLSLPYPLSLFLFPRRTYRGRRSSDFRSKRANIGPQHFICSLRTVNRKVKSAFQNNNQPKLLVHWYNTWCDCRTPAARRRVIPNRKKRSMQKINTWPFQVIFK